MARSQNQKKHFSIKLRYLVLFLILLALLLAAVGTVAWMRYIRSLQTVTMVQVTNLSLVGPDDNTLAIDLGDLDVSTGGSVGKEYVFGVKSVNLKTCTIQLAHTTNIRFTYEIYKATKNDNSFTYDDSDLVDGDYLNKNENNVAFQGDNDYFTKTYENQVETPYSVQENAAPLYWQSDSDNPVSITENDITYFVLKVTWENQKNTKETDMVYLTVGTGGGAS
ncbi:MAG: hypothetical protein SO355_01920 [Candidatus Faecousia sp.]|nr:hypothetical protein [Candidatus Faecousia sp.]